MKGSQNFPMKHFVSSSLRSITYKSLFHCVPEPRHTPKLSFVWGRVLGHLASSSPGTERVDECTAKRRGTVTPRYICIVKWTRDRRDPVATGEKGGPPGPTVGSPTPPFSLQPKSPHYHQWPPVMSVPSPMSLLALHLSKHTPHFNEYNIKKKRGMYQM